jgi:hypothetical protein
LVERNINMAGTIPGVEMAFVATVRDMSPILTTSVQGAELDPYFFPPVKDRPRAGFSTKLP